MKKYCLIESNQEYHGQKLYQIQALRDFTAIEGIEIKQGDLGGFVSGEHNLSHQGNCWIANQAKVLGQAFVSENAFVRGFCVLCDQVQVFGNAQVIRGYICGKVQIYDNAFVGVKGWIAGQGQIFGNASISGKDTTILGNIKIFDNAIIGGSLIGTIHLQGNINIAGNARIEANCNLKGDTLIQSKNIAILHNDDAQYDEKRVDLFVCELRNNPDVSVEYLQNKFSLSLQETYSYLEMARYLFNYRNLF
ncbi:hypothetical protein [Mannheimia indoligenes]|uniref:hypothetical protein n=1 Tax=Mannheimia indoligenes TaxID=3103145 RepID=UPI002FE62499